VRARAPICSVLAVLAAAASAVPTGAATAAPTARARVVPARAAFGDPLLYEVRVTLSGEGGSDAVVIAGVAPFTALAASTMTRSTVNGVTVVTVTQRVACLDRGCLPGARARRVVTAAVAVRQRAGTVVVPSSRAVVSIAPRVPLAVVGEREGGFRADASVPPATTRVSAGALAGLVAALVATLLISALALLWPDLRGRLHRQGRPDDVDAFARALRLLRESAARAGADRRRAADLVGRLVGAGGDRSQAARAAALAWSRPEPRPVDAVDLAEAVARRAASALDAVTASPSTPDPESSA
jgi:hypothetical protein